MTQLTGKTLTRLNAAVAVPRYDRREVTTGIVHIGVGNFHRSHQAMYLDTLMNSGNALDWGICGIGLQSSNVRMRDALAAQDGLYTLVLRHGDGTWDARVIGSIVEYLFAPDDPEAAIEKMAAPATRIVSLTVTEGGYSLDAVTGEFDPSDQSVLADLRPGAEPRGMFGLVTEALARPARPRPARLHHPVLRQHPGQRPREPACVHRVRAAARPRARGLDSRSRPLSQLHGGPHHAQDGRRGPGRAQPPVRPRRPVAGAVRAVHAVGARG